MARTSILALLLTFVLIGSYSYWWQVSTLPVLTPSTILSACPGDEVVINCNISGNTANTKISLRWEVAPMNNLLSVIELPLSDLNNNTNRQEAGLEFYAELTSYSPLSTILTTTAHSAINGATVRCVAAGLPSSDPLIIRIIQILDQPEIQWLNVTGEWFEADNLTVIIEWKDNSDCLDFTISLTSPADISSDYSITTRNRRHTFNILYNTNYTVTVTVADIDSSGNKSDIVSKTFNFVKCEPLPHQENVVISEYVSPALENSQIFFSCLPSYDPLFTTEYQAGQWNPHPMDICGQGVTVTESYYVLIIASLGAVIALLCLIVLGTLSALLITHKYCKKGSQPQGSEVIPGSDLLTPNVSYEPTIISQKRVSHGNLELERNPAYVTSVVHM